MTDCLLFLRDDTWKRVRSILTPSFSAAKMKEVRRERVRSCSDVRCSLSPAPTRLFCHISNGRRCCRTISRPPGGKEKQESQWHFNTLSLLRCVADGPAHQHGQRRPDDKPQQFRRVGRILWHLQVSVPPQQTPLAFCVAWLCVFLQVLRLLHHGRHRQRCVWDPRGLTEPRGRPFCPPCQAVLFLFLLQAPHAFILLVQNFFFFPENIFIQTSSLAKPIY